MDIKESFESRINRVSNNENQENKKDMYQVLKLNYNCFQNEIAARTGNKYYRASTIGKTAELDSCKQLEQKLLYNSEETEANFKELYLVMIEAFAAWNRKEEVKEKWREAMPIFNQTQELLKLELEKLNQQKVKKKPLFQRREITLEQLKLEIEKARYEKG